MSDFGTTPARRASVADGTRLNSSYALAAWALVAIGVVLRVWQFAGFTSLWFDEINLARNIAERSYAGLIRPLDYGQVAPVGFLLAERFFWSLFHSDWALRVLPLVGAVTSAFLFRALAVRVLTGVAVPVSVAAFALGEPFIAWGSQVKQYSTDVAIALVILLATARLLDGPQSDRTRRYAFAGLTGFLSVWFSNPALLVVGGVGTVIGALALRGLIDDLRHLFLLTLIPWAVGALGALVLSLHAVSPQTMEYMHVYWSSRFPPWPPWSTASLQWHWHALHSVFGKPDGLRYPQAVTFICAVLSLGGFVVLWRRRSLMALILAGPVVAAFGAATAQRYPFGGRLVLYLTPILLLTAAAAGGWAAERLGRHSDLAFVALTLALVAAPVVCIVVNPPVYPTEPVRQQFEWLATRWRPGDIVQVFYWAAPGLSWYAARHGLASAEIVWGGCWPAEPLRFLQDIDQVRGRPRVWLVIEAATRPQAKLVVAYADRIGIRRDGMTIAPYIATWLYDFSDSTRLRHASADSFPVSMTTPTRFHLLSCPLGLFKPQLIR